MLVEADNALVRGLTSPQRDRGRLTATTAPVSLPSFSFFELAQHGLGEDLEVRPVRGAAVCRPVRATFHRHATLRHHRSTGQNLSAAPRRRHHGLLVDRGLLHRLRHLHRPAGLGAPEVYGLYEEEVPHREEEVEARGPRICDPVHITLLCLPHRQLRANESERDADIPSTVLTHVEQVTSVTPIAPAAPGPAVPGQAAPTPAAPGANQDRNQNGAGARPETNGTVPGIPGNSGRPFNMTGLGSRSGSTAAYHIPPYAYTGPLRFLCASDARADVFVDSFMFWMDTVEMVRVAGHPLVFYSGWVFPIYIFSYLSCLRVVVMPHSPLLSSLGVAVQDLPFFFVRVGLIAFFGFVTPLLYLMKNLLVCLAFVYFNFMTKLRIFNTERMFF